MKCPNCQSSSCRYIIKRNKVCSANRPESKLKEPRTDFRAECKKCGWSGEI